MDNIDLAIRRAQVYRFLADVFLHPSEHCWTDDAPLIAGIARALFPTESWNLETDTWDHTLGDLQSEHRRVFGLTGSLCYETEFGLPNEFRMSQELADIAGFYRAFGFNVGGTVRERPDHIAAELEFMYVLALKEAYAAETGVAEHVEICVDAQRKFLQEHLGRWIGPLAESLARSAEQGSYVAAARFAAAFVKADAASHGAALEERGLAGVKPTPLGPELMCEGCGTL